MVRERHAVANYQRIDTKGSHKHWFGRVATADGKTKPWKIGYEKIDEALVRDWILQQRSSDDDELGFSLLAQVLADEITKKLCGNQAARKELLKALPLITRPSLRRDRLRLGAVVPGTASRGTTLQRLPRYSWNTRPLVFLRGVLQLRRRLPAGSEVRNKLDKADKALRRIGVVSIMSAASLRTFDSEKDRMLKGSGLKAVRSWCAIGEWIARKEILVWNKDELQTRGPNVLEKTEWFVFLPTLFEARVRTRLRELLNRDHPNKYVVDKDYRRMNSFPTHKASPDVVYREGEEDGTPIAIYECKLYKKVQADLLHHMHQVEAQRAAFGNPGLVGLIYGLFTDDPDLPKKKDKNVHYIDLRGTKDRATESFDDTLERLRDAVLAAEARDVATQPGLATI